MNTAEGCARVGSKSKERSGKTSVVHTAVIQTVVGEFIDARRRLSIGQRRDVAGHRGGGVGLGHAACRRPGRSVIGFGAGNGVQSRIQFQETGIADMAYILPELKVQADVA